MDSSLHGLSDQKQVQEQIDSNYLLLKMAGEVANFGGWSVDLDNNIITWSDVVADIHEAPRGYSPRVEEGINYYAPEWRDKITKVFNDCAQKGIPYDEDMEIITQKGNRVWVRTIGKAVKNKDGKIVQVQGAFQDITERMLMQEALRKSENLFKKVFEILPIGLWIADKDGKLLHGNPAGVKIWGREPKVDQSQYGIFKARRLPSREEILPDDWALAHTIKKGVTIVDELLEIDAFDGKKKIILNYTAPLLDLLGEVEGAIVVNQDITDQKQAEIQLEKERQQFFSIFNSIEEAIYISDPFTYEILFANNFLIKTLGEDYKGKKCFELFHNLKAPCDFCTNQIILNNNGEVYQWDHYNHKLNRHFLIFDRIIDWSDGSKVRFEMAIDITKRKKAEMEIVKLNEDLEQRIKERTAQLEASNKELEAFSYSVSHDLRAPLRSIDGFSQMLYEDHGSKLDKEAIRILNVIRDSAQKMDRLIYSLLEMAKVRRHSMKKERVNMASLLESIIADYQGIFDDYNITLILDFIPDSYCNLSLIRQVWSNLIDNAIKFTRPKDIGKIEIKGTIDGNQAIYQITDTGVGFNPAYIKKLFKPFSTLHSQVDFPESIGIGLSLSERIIHRHGGKIWAESIEGEGATFYFSLPIK